MPPSPRVFGEVPGVAVGSPFTSRREAFDVGVHRQLQAGIAGTSVFGAESIVLSDGYEDDEDHGDFVVYTGHGGQENGRQVRDQKPTDAGNAALITSSMTGAPVRVIRGPNPRSKFAPVSGYRYDGLFRVESFWVESGRSGFLMCRYKLVSLETYALDLEAATGTTTATPALAAGNPQPGRRAATVQRVVRSSAVVDGVKAIHDHTCQVCQTRLEIRQRGYSEGAQIRPLGLPHNGPDVPSNVLCLCPNCHVLFDNGMITLSEDLMIIRGAHAGKALRVHPRHIIDVAHTIYHRRLFSV